MQLNKYILFQRRENYLRLRIWRLNFYVANHAMQLIRFEKSARQRRRRRLRGHALDRAGHKCEICGCDIDWKSVSVHHKKPRVLYPELEFDPDNVQALCHSCHARIHELERLATLGVSPAVLITNN